MCLLRAAALLGGWLPTDHQDGEEEDLGEPVDDATASAGVLMEIVGSITNATTTAAAVANAGGAGLDQSGGVSVVPSALSRKVKRKVSVVDSAGASSHVSISGGEFVASHGVSGLAEQNTSKENGEKGRKKVKQVKRDE